MNPFVNFAVMIAEYAIALDVPVYRFEKEKYIQWSSGDSHPFYFNGRKILSDPGARKVLTEALVSLISNRANLDYVYGIPQAGIAPAVLVCLKLNKPMLIKIGNNYFSINIHIVKELVKDILKDYTESIDIIAGTTPLGIIFGITAAEQLNKKFLFVREQPKNHGLKEQVEGIIEKDARIFLMDPVCNGVKNYVLEAIRALTDHSMEVIEFCSPDISSYLKDVSLSGKTIVSIDDVTSTGKSSLSDIRGLLDIGANVLPRSIFSYDLPVAEKNFKDCELINKSVLGFEELVGQLERLHILQLSEMLGLTKWHESMARVEK